MRTVNGPLPGSFQIPGIPIKTSDYPADPPDVAPLLGEHNGEILTEQPAMNNSEIEALMAHGELVCGAS